MVVSWWILAFFAQCTFSPFTCYNFFCLILEEMVDMTGCRMSSDKLQPTNLKKYLIELDPSEPARRSAKRTMTGIPMYLGVTGVTKGQHKVNDQMLCRFI